VATCGAIKPNGERCAVEVRPGQAWCYNHDPARADERRRNASKAARSKPSRELAGVKAQLQEMADKVLRCELNRADAAVCGQLLNIKLRALEIERKWRELGELEERIQALEAQQEQKGVRPWRGA
jgi:hypothetical protein